MHELRSKSFTTFGFLATIMLATWLTGRLPAAEQNRFDYRQTNLDNGLTVISLEDFSCPIVAVHLWYHVGSKDEDPERQGFAHMFEHMMFRGSDRLGSTDHFDLIRKTGGTSNAYTTFDQTVYTQTLPANQLNLALWLEAERMSMLKIDQEAFDTERKVVEEERRMGVNRPYGTLLEKALPELFPDHPYRWPTIGSIPHLRAAAVPELRAFWNKYYVPNNATLVVVGAAKHETVLQLATRNFGWIKRRDAPPRIDPPSRSPYQAREIVLKEKNAPAPLVGLVFRGVPLSHEDATALDLMTTILGGGESSRLYRRIVADDQSAVAAMSGVLSLEQDGVLACGALLSPLGGKPDQVLAAMREEIARIQRESVTDTELAKAKNQSLRSLVTETLTVDSKASALGQAAVLEGDVARVNGRLERIRDVSVADIQRVANTYFDLDHAVVGKVERNLLGALGSLVSKDSVEDAPITGEPETNPPRPGRPGVERPESFPAQSPIAGLLNYDPDYKYEEVRFENGLRLIVVENHEVPFVSVQLGLKAGAWTDEIEGTATFAMAMLTKGTEKHTEKQLAEELESKAISLGGSAGADASSVVLSCLPEQLDRGLELMAEVITQPTMPEDEFKKLLRQARTSLAVSSKEPTYLASRAFRRQLYGDHPYSQETSGTLESLSKLTVDDTRRWWSTHIRPDEATLIFAGDTDLETAGKLARKYFAAWSVDTPVPQIDIAPVPPRKPTKIYLVDHTGNQSQIRVGHVAFDRQDADYMKSRVVGGYFGGAFGSRLNRTIRVEKGLTYGANGGFSSQKRAGVFLVSTFSKTASTVDALKAILEEIDRLQSEPPSTQELEDTKSYFLGAFPSDRETPQQVASDVWFTRSMGLSDNYFDQLIDEVNQTTSDDCLRIAKTRIHPNELVIVVVGPASELKAGLETIAPVEIVEAD